jgi:hypothetical protein
VELLIAENVVAWRGSRYAKAWKPLRAVFIPSYLSFGHSVLIGRYSSVLERDKIALSIGDRLRFTENVKHCGRKFLNNELRHVLGVDEARSYSTRRYCS